MTNLIPGKLYEIANQRIMDWSCFRWYSWHNPIMFIRFKRKRDTMFEYTFLVGDKILYFSVANNYRCGVTSVYKIQFESNLVLVDDKM